MTPPLLQMQSVSLSFGETHALDGVDLQVASGEVHALLGENGAGKSTLMKVLAGALRPDAGSLRLGEEEFAPIDPREAQQRGVAMIYQELTVLPHLSIAQNVCLGQELARCGVVDRKGQRAAVLAVLRRLRRQDLDPDARVATLAPAERQLVEIARALHQQARILVMDEPTSSLGADDVAHLFAVIRELRQQGLAIVYISHFLEEVRAVADRFTVLRDGRTVATGNLTEISDAQLVAHMAGRSVDQQYPPRRAQRGAVALAVADLEGAPLPRHASLTLHHGEILGIGGLCGAGRSELLETLFGLRPRRGGHVERGAGPLASCPAQLWQQGVGMLVEDRKNVGLSVRRPLWHNLLLPDLRRLSRCGWLAPAVLRRHSQRWIDEFAVRARGPQQLAGVLSGGNQQKLALARLLQAEATVLLLDEPTRGIDVQSRHEIYQWLDRLARQGAAILMVSSQLEELLGLCDRIAVMRRGQLLPARPADAWTQESLLAAALQPQEACA